jgi:Na+-transporting methylmalonyl-CoA/oxaloacetate decarboxylase gamma subunit
MVPFSFADFLFLFLTLLITFTILWFVNKAKEKGRETPENLQSEAEVNSDMDES